MPRIERTSRAQVDLVQIWLYVAEDNIAAADRFIDAIERQLVRLAEMPGMGRPRPELARELRSFPIKSHVIFYRRIERGIQVVRVLHGARDIESLFDS
jgi:toxin ParE1/3/4